MAEHNKLGNWGEQIVVDYLVTQGFAIEQRNWRLNHLEIDIIATKSDIVVFVEVKTRSNTDINPLDAITPQKIRLLATAANAYIRHTKLPLSPRFDVAAVTGNPHDYTLNYIPNAFRPPLRTYR